MKFLLDSGTSVSVKLNLEAAGHDVVRVVEWGTDPGDEIILARAYEEGRVLVTIDKDFGELAVVHGFAHAGIIRLVNMSARQQGTMCLSAL